MRSRDINQQQRHGGWTAVLKEREREGGRERKRRMHRPHCITQS